VLKNEMFRNGSSVVELGSEQAENDEKRFLATPAPLAIPFRVDKGGAAKAGPDDIEVGPKWVIDLGG